MLSLRSWPLPIHRCSVQTSVLLLSAGDTFALHLLARALDAACSVGSDDAAFHAFSVLQLCANKLCKHSDAVLTANPGHVSMVTDCERRN